MAIQPFIICKSRKTAMLRYEVYNKNMVKAFVLSSGNDIGDLPYLEKEKIMNVRKDLLYQSRNSAERHKSLTSKPNPLLGTPLNRVPNSNLLSYFCISSQAQNPNINISA